VSGGAAPPVLRGPRVLLRPVAEDDLDAVLAILAEPEVARWWPPGDPGETRAELLRPGVGLAIVVGGEVAGATPAPSGPTPPSASGRSACCAPTSAAPTAPGTTACSSCSPASRPADPVVAGV
jgi:hypothetical protein